jgi:signal transduction histidine kinase
MTTPVHDATQAGHAPVAAGDTDTIAEACSHQLGEAVTIVTGYLDVLRESGGSSPATLRALEGGVGRVRRVVEDLLDLTRVAGREAVPVPVELGVAVSRAVGELGPDASGLDVVVGELPAVLADEAQLVCVLRQVLRAAAAARGPAQDHVRVTVVAGPTPDGRVLVSVCDDASATPGLVVGLARGRGPLVGAGAAEAIVNRIVAAHGGRCARSTPEDDGFRIDFDLPRTS